MNRDEFLKRVEIRINDYCSCSNVGIKCDDCQKFIHKKCMGDMKPFLKLYYKKEMIKKNLEAW